MWLEILAVLSFVVGIGGTTIAILERRSRIRVEAMRITHLSAAINRLTTMLSWQEKVRAMVENVEKAEVVEWVWSRYKGMSDLYVMIVSHYLSLEKRFTYDDLRTMVENGLIPSKWEESIWRGQMAQRPENKGVPVPLNFIP